MRLIVTKIKLKNSLNRNIKFRIWDGVALKFSFPNEKKFSLRSDGCLIAANGICDTFYTYQISTGHCDKNGVEMYEGDIVRYTSSDYTFHEKITWEYFGWTTQSKTGKFAHPMACLDYEVIGNIMENPNLLIND